MSITKPLLYGHQKWTEYCYLPTYIATSEEDSNWWSEILWCSGIQDSSYQAFAFSQDQRTCEITGEKLYLWRACAPYITLCKPTEIINHEHIQWLAGPLPESYDLWPSMHLPLEHPVLTLGLLLKKLTLNKVARLRTVAPCCYLWNFQWTSKIWCEVALHLLVLIKQIAIRFVYPYLHNWMIKYISIIKVHST